MSFPLRTLGLATNLVTKSVFEGFTMNAAEFFRTIVKANYDEFLRNPQDLRLLWNAVVSMNTVAEYVALERLGYEELSRVGLGTKANQIGTNSQLLLT
jgi:hypothetical protein